MSSTLSTIDELLAIGCMWINLGAGNGQPHLKLEFSSDDDLRQLNT